MSAAGPTVACVEAGGSGLQTVVFRDGRADIAADTAGVADADLLGLAVPGIIADGRVVVASNLGWHDVDPAERLGLPRSADLVLNDGEAAALGESSLRGDPDLVFVGLGTGVGGAVVAGGTIVSGNLFGHAGGFSTDRCPCGRVGCLETVAAGWALPSLLRAADERAAGAATARAILEEPTAQRASLVVVAGGLARRYPGLVAAISRGLPDRSVETSAAPPEAKSASAWGIRAALASAAVRE
jgi:hypothetical protein